MLYSQLRIPGSLATYLFSFIYSNQTKLPRLQFIKNTDYAYATAPTPTAYTGEATNLKFLPVYFPPLVGFSKVVLNLTLFLK